MATSQETLEITSESVEQTLNLGRVIGEHVEAGLVIALSGPLGAGKTHLAKGIASGLEITEWQRVHSPTFTLMNSYAGRFKLNHIDFYRIVDAVALPPEIVEAIESQQDVSVIEWADRFAEVFSGCQKILYIDMDHLSEDGRKLVLKAVGFERGAMFEAVATA